MSNSKMTKFKVGDRIAVYGYDSERGDNYGSYAVVSRVYEDRLRIEWDTSSALKYAVVHPKQCRRLKPKAPVREPRRIHILKDSLPATRSRERSWIHEGPSPKNYDSGCIEFVEVMPAAKKGNK